MKQNYFKHLLAALLLLCTTAASAHDFVVDGIYYNIKDAVNKTVEVTYKGISHSEFFDEYTGDVVIPGIVLYNDVTYSVASIGESAFKICSELTSIKIPNNITSIGDDAFYGCTGLKEIYVFSEEPATIKSKTFSYHSATLYVPVGARSAYANASYWADFTNITEYVDKDLVFEVTSEGKATVSVTAYTGNQPIVAIPSHYTIDGKTYTVTSLGRYTFDGCTSLTSIVIPNSVTSIGSYTFRGCSALTSVHISDLAAWCNIDFGIFYNPNAIKAPENRGIAKIPPGYYGFATNPLTSALYLNGELVKNLVIPDGIKKIKSGAFYGYRGLESVEIPNSVTNIEEFAFSFCSGLTSVEISNSVTSIGTCAFEGCTGLTSIEIPGSVTSIGNEAFRGCTGLTSIEIPGSITSIRQYAFDGCTGLKEVHISDIATWCGIDFGSGSANPLRYAKNLYLNGELVTELVIPEGIKEIRDYAFYGFTGFTSIEIPNSVTSIEDYVFYGCSRLISIEIPNCVTEIGVCAFNGTAWYDNLPDGVVYAGKVLYKYKGTMLSNTSIAVKDGTVCIADSAFSYCTGLTAIEIPGSVTMIGNSAFFGCKSLKDLRIEDGEGGLSLGYNRYNMASLGVGLFSECPLETLYLGRDLYYISDFNFGYSPFEYIETLTSITIGNNVTGFGRSLFRGCTGLTAVYISDLAAWCGIGFDDIYANPLYYVKKMYLNGELLTELVIPEGVEWIRRYAFSNCSSLTSVEIPNSVTSIGACAFEGCSSLTSVEIPNSVTSIGQSAFEGCSSFTSVEIPASVTKIGSKAFLGCTGLKEIYSLSAEPATIYDDTFDNYSATLNVLLGSKSAYEKADYWKNFTNIVEILDEDLVFTITSEVDATVAVTGYTGKQTIVTIPSHYTIDGKSYTVTSIGESAFNGCKGLKSIVIPNSVKSIGALAFYECGNLKEVHISDIAAWCGIDFKSASENPLYYAKNLYLNGELVTELVIPEGVKEIKFSAFRYCTSFTSIEIPNSVTNIGVAAFSDCPGLSSITVAAGNTKYDSRENSNAIIETATNTLIAGCKNTKIPNSVESIGRFAFCGCTGLTSIEIPNSVESIGSFAFGYCSGLTSIVIPDSVAFIDEFAFIECTGLTKIVVTEDNTVYDSRNNCNAIIETATNSLILGCQNTVIPNSVTSIGKYAFSYCSGLTAIEIPNSVKSIGDNAFYYCSGLTNVVIGNSVESIGREAFYNCTGLTSVTIPNSVTSIGGWAFSGCNGLTNVVIGNGVTSIGKDAFAFCFRITSIKIPDSVTSIEDGAFRYCSGLTSIEIPSSVTSIGNNAFRSCSGLKEIHSLSAKPATIQSSTFDNYSATLYVLLGSKSAYEKAAYWKNFTKIVENVDKDLVFTITSEEDATVAVTDYTGNQAIVTIPSHYVIDGKRYTVTAIGENAFDGCRGLTSIEIPNSVTSIGEYAFRSCSGLTSVEIPNSITSIGYNAFVLCTGLKSIEIPASVTNLENSAFSSCSGLESIVVAEGNTVYDSRNNCNAIIETATNTLVLGCQNTIIPGSVTSIGHSSFYMCSGLTSIEIPNSVTTIEDYAFGYCTGLASIEIPNSVTSIGVSVFEKCTGLTSVAMGNGVTSIGSSAFDDCDGLKEVHINDLAAWCGIDFGNRDANPLYYAKKLYLNGEQVTELVIPAGVKDIKNYTFSNCSGLASVEIPASVTSIGAAAFSYCPGLSSITVAAGNTKYDSRENSNAIIETATNTLVAGCKNTIIPNSVTSIGDNAFQGCEGLTSIVIPNSVESIGWNAFYGCAGLKLVLNYSDLTFRIGSSEYGYIAYYADKVTNAPNGFVDGDFVWGENVHTGSYILCSYLGDATELTLPADCKGLNYEIGEAVFYGRTGLTSVVIPNGVTGIGGNAFYGCTGLTNIVIPNSVTFIGNSAFYSCTGLTNIVIPNSVTFIGDNAFSGCKGLTSVEIPDSVTSIGDYTFSGCYGLTSVTIPNSVTSIGDYAFYGCSRLTSVTIPNSVTSIGDYAFRNCGGLTSVTIGNSVESIGDYAFRNCDELTSVELPAALTCIGEEAFARCSLTTIVIPANVKSIGNNAFADNRKLTEVTSLISAEKLFAIPAIMSRAYYRRCTLYVNIGAKETYAVTEGWNQFKDIVEMDLSAIEDVLADGLSDADAVFYDLNGRVVEYPTNGIYIVNGKKVFVK